VFLSRNLDQSMLKNAYFLGKTVKIVSESEAPMTEGSVPRLLRCYSRLLLQFCRVRFSAKYILFALKKGPSNYSKIVLPLLLSHFCTFILFQTL